MRLFKNKLFKIMCLCFLFGGSILSYDYNAWSATSMGEDSETREDVPYTCNTCESLSYVNSRESQESPSDYTSSEGTIDPNSGALGY